VFRTGRAGDVREPFRRPVLELPGWIRQNGGEFPIFRELQELLVHFFHSFTYPAGSYNSSPIPNAKTGQPPLPKARKKHFSTPGLKKWNKSSRQRNRFPFAGPPPMFPVGLLRTCIIANFCLNLGKFVRVFNSKYPKATYPAHSHIQPDWIDTCNDPAGNQVDAKMWESD